MIAKYTVRCRSLGWGGGGWHGVQGWITKHNEILAQALREALNDQQSDAMEQQKLALRNAMHKRRQAELKLQQHYKVETQATVARMAEQHRRETAVLLKEQEAKMTKEQNAALQESADNHQKMIQAVIQLHQRGGLA